MLLLDVHPLLESLCISLIILLCCYSGMAQTAEKKDSILQSVQTAPDSIYRKSVMLADTLVKGVKQQFVSKRKQLAQAFKSAGMPSLPSKDGLAKNLLKNPYRNLFQLSKPWIHADGGYVAYNFNYRSNTDTPYAEKNIAQHTINGSLNFTVAKALPFIANVWVRRSNSQFYRNITDVQLQFNAIAFRNQVMQQLRERLATVGKVLKDSTIEKLYYLKNRELSGLGSWLQNPLTFQKFIQANETLKVPEKNYDISKTDSSNKQHTDSLQITARKYMEEYQQKKALYEKTKKETDSLEQLYLSMKSKVAQYESFIKNGSLNTASLPELQNELKRFGVIASDMPPSLKWLLGVRNFSLGKAPLNYSELTTKNTSLNGINLEYNSWYYLALSAGLVDYRFNDVIVNRTRQAPSYMVMVRAGLGKPESDHFIVSVYKGQKQQYSASQTNVTSVAVPVAGVSAELRWQISAYAYALAEVAESASPDYHYNPAKKSSFDFSDNSNKAISFKAYWAIPLTGTRLEGMYKNAGSNFQSFSTFQTTAALKSWYVKGEQTLLKRTLKLTASVRSNDFSSPYITQNYKSNTIFTSLSASLRIRKIPVVTIGYMPMSQYTILGNQLVENKFQTLMANISHYYKIGTIRATSFFSLNKFYNSGIDTGFIFYNASNMIIGQSFYFSDFTANINLSRSISPRYELNVASEDISFSLSKKGSAGIGVKLNSYNSKELKLGQFMNINYQIGSMDYISLNYERGFLPGTNGGKLLLNNFGNVQFIKRFR